MEGLVNEEDAIRMMEEQLSIKESEEMKLRADIEKLQQQNSNTSELLIATIDRPDNTLNR